MRTAASPKPGIANTVRLHQINQQRLLSVLQTGGTLSVVELARRFDVPIRTITRLVSSLIESGLLTTAALQGKRAIGKPPTLLKVNEAFASIMAVELGAVTTRLGLADFSGRLLKCVALPTEQFLPDFSVGLRRALQAFRADCDGAVAAGPLAGLAIGASGLMDVRTGKVRIGLLPNHPVGLRQRS